MAPAPAGGDRSDAHTVLSVTNLTIDLPKDGDRAHAVRDVSFDVKSGEIVCLVGESGSGKSVIAFSIMGLLAKALTVSGGSVLLNGEELVDTDERRLRDLRCTGMGMIFQEPMTALNPVMPCGVQLCWPEWARTVARPDCGDGKHRRVQASARNFRRGLDEGRRVSLRDYSA